MPCPKCNFENPPEARFCGKCGEALRTPAPPPPADDGVSQELKIGIAIGSIFLPPLGIVMGAVYLNSPQREKKQAGQLWLLIGIGALIFQCGCAAFYWYDNYS